MQRRSKAPDTETRQIREAVAQRQAYERDRQRYTQAIVAAIDEAFMRMVRGEANTLYLYFKPHGLEFRVFSEMEDPTGYELVTSERISGFKTREQLLTWARPLCDRCPVLPV